MGRENSYLGPEPEAMRWSVFVCLWSPVDSASASISKVSNPLNFSLDTNLVNTVI